MRRLLIVLAVLSALPALAQDVRFFRIAAGDGSGSAFAVATLIGGAISKPPGGRPCESGGGCGVPGLIAVTRTTSGSVENIELIWRNEAEAGLAEADVVTEAFYGEGRFENLGAVNNLRAVANLFPAAAHLVVRQDSGLHSVEDLRGKRIALGPLGSGNRAHGQRVLEAFGLRPVDYIGETDDIGSASDRLQRGEIEAMFVLGGYPVPGIDFLARSVPIDLLPLVGPGAQRLLAQNPFFSLTAIPIGTYAGVPTRRTVAIGMQLVVSSAVPEDLVREITRALWHPRNRPAFEAGAADVQQIRLQTALDGLTIPLHQGAAAYYLEAGVFRQPEDPSKGE